MHDYQKFLSFNFFSINFIFKIKVYFLNTPVTIGQLTTVKIQNI